MAETKYYASRIDWWIYAVVIGTFLLCVPIGVIDKDFLLMTILGVGFVALEIFVFASIAYAIKGDKLGVRMYYKWTWYPIDRIAEAKKTHGILTAPACSTHRVAIKFLDRSILKSYMPLEISPEDRDGFIADLRTVNPDIIVK